ncbi:hypothetical protein AMTR_s00128p00045300 [Amborella trichopoda]|uniref:Uncharacterized protein n=1 Tax=Amborella trichopoda TaxID=13333 RepID=W1NLT3_AMBTC|nr:hypothetical protein AMTR_s00128p00045300 [Amborella trichopoda]
MIIRVVFEGNEAWSDVTRDYANRSGFPKSDGLEPANIPHNMHADNLTGSPESLNSSTEQLVERGRESVQESPEPIRERHKESYSWCKAYTEPSWRG